MKIYLGDDRGIDFGWFNAKIILLLSDEVLVYVVNDTFITNVNGTGLLYVNRRGRTGRHVCYLIGYSVTIIDFSKPKRIIHRIRGDICRVHFR